MESMDTRQSTPLDWDIMSYFQAHEETGQPWETCYSSAFPCPGFLLE